MKKRIYIIICFLFLHVNNACCQNASIQIADSGGVPKSWALGFSIGQHGYIALGIAGGKGETDFWEYDTLSDSWSQKARFPGHAGQNGVAFSIYDKGYIGTGYDRVKDLFSKDFWEYDPHSNSWNSKPAFPGTGRMYAVGFSIGGKGYIGTGKNMLQRYENDFWAYDPKINSWSRKADFTCQAGVGAIGFSNGTRGYIGTGGDPDMFRYNFYDIYEYDSLTDSWKWKTFFSDNFSYNVTAFSINGKAYVADQTKRCNDPYEYNPITDEWLKKKSVAFAWRETNFSFVNYWQQGLYR